MSAPTTVRSATRRLVGLTALRWLPVGLTTPIMVLLAQSRGLTLGEIGVLFTVHGAVILALELPTGGLADVLGRRAVVVVGALLHLASCVVTATATSFESRPTTSPRSRGTAATSGLPASTTITSSPRSSNRARRSSNTAR